MSDFPSSSSAADDREAQVRVRYQQAQSRFFLTFAMVEGLLLAAAVVVVYVLELVAPETGTWVLVGIAMAGGAVISAYVVTQPKRMQQEIEQVRRLG